MLRLMLAAYFLAGVIVCATIVRHALRTGARLNLFDIIIGIPLVVLIWPFAAWEYWDHRA